MQELDDPMRPPASHVVPVAAGTPEEPVALPRLQAIMRDGQQRSAVINGRVVRVGDEVDGAMVDAISASSVVVSVGGNSSVLKLVGQDIKHDARATH